MTIHSSGPAMLRRALPLYFAIGIAATVLFAGQGLDASTVVHIAERTATARFVLLALWVVAAMPAMRALWTTEQNMVLRPLPIPRRWIVIWLAALAVLAEAPWLVLWLRGGGVSKALVATLTALALHACLVARVRTPGDALLVATPCAVWLAPAPVTPGSLGPATIARIIASAIVFVIALDRAWRRAPEIPASSIRAPVAGSPVRALATAYGVVLLRAHASALLRASTIVAIGFACAGLTITNDDALRTDAGAAIRALLAIFIPCSVLASATAAGPVLRAERRAEWVFAATGTASAVRRGATASLHAAAGSAVGLLGGTVLAVILDFGGGARVVLVSVSALTGATMSALTEGAMRWAVRDAGRDGGRVVLALLALIAVAEGALRVW